MNNPRKTCQNIFTFFLLAEQWSPINTEGKKQYGRDFLLKLANDPLSKQKPSNMPPMDIIKDKPNVDKAKFPLPQGPMSKDWTPSFIKSTTSKVQNPFCFAHIERNLMDQRRLRMLRNFILLI